MTEPMVTVEVTQYTVSALPESNINHDTWSVTVEYRGAGRWAVLRSSKVVLNRLTSEWEYEFIPSERTEEWLEAHQFESVNDALTAAKAVAPLVRINGLTAMDVLERTDG